MFTKLKLFRNFAIAQNLNADISLHNSERFGESGYVFIKVSDIYVSFILNEKEISTFDMMLDITATRLMIDVWTDTSRKKIIFCTIRELVERVQALQLLNNFTFKFNGTTQF